MKREEGGKRGEKREKEEREKRRKEKGGKGGEKRRKSKKKKGGKGGKNRKGGKKERKKGGERRKGGRKKKGRERKGKKREKHSMGGGEPHRHHPSPRGRLCPEGCGAAGGCGAGGAALRRCRRGPAGVGVTMPGGGRLGLAGAAGTSPRNAAILSLLFSPRGGRTAMETRFSLPGVCTGRPLTAVGW